MSLSRCIAIVLVLCAVIPGINHAQNKENEIERLKAALLALEKNSTERIQALETLIKALQEKIARSEKEEEMKKLLEQAKRLASEKKEKGISLDKKFHSGLRQQSALNPNISLGGDFYFAYGSSSSEYNRIPSEEFPEVT